MLVVQQIKLLKIHVTHNNLNNTLHKNILFYSSRPILYIIIIIISYTDGASYFIREVSRNLYNIVLAIIEYKNEMFKFIGC